MWEVLFIVNLDGVELLVKNRFVKVDVIVGSLGSMSFWDRCQVDVILGSMSFWDRIGLHSLRIASLHIINNISTEAKCKRESVRGWSRRMQLR